MSIFKKKAFQPEHGEVFASSSFDLRAPKDLSRLRTNLATGRAKAARPWKWYNEIGEINYGIDRGARLAGYAQIQARELTKDGRPGKVMTSGPAYEIAQRLSSPYGGVRGLVERFFTLMKVPGECYLIRTRDADGDVDGYDFLSSDEIDRASLEGRYMSGETNIPAGTAIRRITLPQNGSAGGEALMTDILAEDFLGRVWRPAGRYVEMAKSPMAALDTSCEVLHLLTIGLRAKLLSRLALNGIVLIDSGVNDIRSGAPSGANQDEIHDNKVIDQLIKASTWAVENHEEPRAALPIFMAAPVGQLGDKVIQHITLNQEIYKTDMALRAELIDRILTGLDVAKKQTEGDGDSNHWNTFSQSDDEMRVNIRPDLEVMCWAITRMVLYREMQELNISPKTIMKYCLWYDLSDASTNINQAEDARQASDRGWINDAAGRRLSGIGEEDAPSEIEWVRQIGRMTKDPYLATFGMEVAKQIDWEKVGSTGKGPPPASPAEDTPVGPGKGPSTKSPTPESDTPRKLRPA